jgi:outer membrane protein TolC
MLSHPAFAQQKSGELVFGLQDFYIQLLAGHPLVRQARLLSDVAQQDIRLARGAFDPKVGLDAETKEFQETLYYRRWQGEIKAQTITGIEVKAGYEQIGGVYFNPQERTPSLGQVYAGVSVPLGQGLFIDARRAALREAQFAQGIAEAERVKLINKVILQATKDYWGWYAAHNSLQIAQKGFDLANDRLIFVKDRVGYGELAPIDSVEANITLQERIVALNDAKVLFNNARLILSNHLWSQDSEPIELTENMVPTRTLNEVSGEQQLQELLAFAQQNHPELLKLAFKLRQLAVVRRLSIEMLKPQLDFNYNFLAPRESPFSADLLPGGFLRNNYKMGFTFAMPLFLRKERAKLAQTNIKIQQTELERTQANREIINSINANYNDLLNFGRNLVVQQANVNNYQVLRDGEVSKFDAGESSLFLVNSRESKLLEAEQKLVDLQFKFAKAQAELRWAAGKGIDP